MPKQGKALPAQILSHLQHRGCLLPEAVAGRRHVSGEAVARQIQRNQIDPLQRRCDAIEGRRVIEPAMQRDHRQAAGLSPDLAGDFNMRQGEANFVTADGHGGLRDRSGIKQNAI